VAEGVEVPLVDQRLVLVLVVEHQVFLSRVSI
jgi:hypothetical protein